MRKISTIGAAIAAAMPMGCGNGEITRGLRQLAGSRINFPQTSCRASGRNGTVQPAGSPSRNQAMRELHKSAPAKSKTGSDPAAAR